MGSTGTIGSVARRRGHAKILIPHPMLPQLAHAVMHHHTVSVALVCHDGKRHVVNRARERTDEHCLGCVLTGTVTDVPVELDTPVVGTVVVKRVVE